MKAPLFEGQSDTQSQRSRAKWYTHIRPAVKKMMALITPTIHSPLAVPTSPNSCGNERFAPLDPVWSHPCVAAPIAHSAIEYQSMGGACHL